MKIIVSTKGRMYVISNVIKFEVEGSDIKMYRLGGHAAFHDIDGFEVLNKAVHNVYQRVDGETRLRCSFNCLLSALHTVDNLTFTGLDAWVESVEEDIV